MVNSQQEDEGHHHGGDEDQEVRGALANATVSFGQWDLEAPSAPGTITPVDRFPNLSPRTQNSHRLIPAEAKITAGGSVNFIISGFHHLLVYGDGTQPADIDRTKLIVRPMLPPLIDDPVDRVYRGLDPASLVMPPLPGTTTPLQSIQDRVEVVRFPTPGQYLVLCGVLPHFFDAMTGEFVMFGFVKVLRNED